MTRFDASASNQLYRGEARGVEDALNLYIRALKAEGAMVEDHDTGFDDALREALVMQEIIKRHLKAAYQEIREQHPGLREYADILESGKFDMLAI